MTFCSNCYPATSIPIERFHLLLYLPSSRPLYETSVLGHTYSKRLSQQFGDGSCRQRTFEEDADSTLESSTHASGRMVNGLLVRRRKPSRMVTNASPGDLLGAPRTKQILVLVRLSRLYSQQPVVGLTQPRAAERATAGLGQPGFSTHPIGYICILRGLLYPCRVSKQAEVYGKARLWEIMNGPQL